MFLFSLLGSILMLTSVGHACTRFKREFLIMGTMRQKQMTEGRRDVSFSEGIGKYMMSSCQPGLNVIPECDQGPFILFMKLQRLVEQK